MTTLVKDRMTTAFTLISADSSPGAVRAQLATETYGVILREDGEPVALIVAEDLDQAAAHNAPTFLDPDVALPPTGLVGSEIDMNILVDSGVVALFNMESRGAIVVGDGERVAGVLPVEAVDEFLGGGEYKPTPKTMGEAGTQGSQLAGTALAGKFQTPLAKLKCLEAECGYINPITELDEENLPPCINPKRPDHTLKIRPL